MDRIEDMDAAYRAKAQTHGVCSDLISRQDIEWTEILVADGDGQYHEEDIAYRSQIDSIPSAEPVHGEWIPVSERLPEIKDHHVSAPCLVYCSNGAYGFAELEENIFGQVGWNCEREDDYHEPLGDVIAWMPMPEPYREVEE